jgi:hypothetical protein
MNVLPTGFASLVAICSVLCSVEVHAVTTVSSPLLIPHPAPESNGGFGRSVGIVGDRILAGALTTDVGVQSSGAAYLFERSSGSLIKSITEPTPRNSALFGTAVGAFRDDLLVTTFSNSTLGRKPGIAYLIDGQTGSYLHTFMSPSASAFDGFGISIGVVGDLIAIGAIIDSTQAANSGVVHIFNGITGQYVRTLQNPHPREDDRFGIKLTAFGNQLLVGSTGGSTGAGAAYLMDPATGEVSREIANPFPSPGDAFGRSVAVVEGDLVIGAPWDDTLGLNTGAVYRFDGQDASLLNVIPNPDPNPGDLFGQEIAVFQLGMAISAPLKDDVDHEIDGFEVGAVFVYGPTGQLSSKITPERPNRQDRFGEALAASGNTLVVGHGASDIGRQDAGVVLVYQVPEPSSVFLFSLTTIAVVGTRRRK